VEAADSSVHNHLLTECCYNTHTTTVTTI